MRRTELFSIEAPLDDEYEALRLLADKGYRHGAYLCLLYRRSSTLRRLYKGPRIVVQHLGGHGDMEVRQEDIYFITERVADMLVTTGWTRGTAHWGYTDEYERHLSDTGSSFYHHTAQEAALGLEAFAKFFRQSNA